MQTFVDASSEAYGAVSYLRTEYAPSCYGARIIAPMSTPRLELMAALLGLHLTLSILVRQHERPVLDTRQRQAVPSIRSKQNRRDSKAIEPRTMAVR